MKFRKIWLLMIIILMMCTGCSENSRKGEIINERQQRADTDSGKLAGDDRGSYEKGYDLPVSDSEKEEAVTDCKKVMGRIRNIYLNADKGGAANVAISDETIRQMKEAVREMKYPVIGSEQYSAMENYRKMEQFLFNSEQKETGTIVLYEIGRDGGIGRKKYSYDGKNMYLLSAKAEWSDANKPMVPHVSYTRIKQWRYTEKGWFGYEVCVPEPPEVTEIVNGSCMIRVKPMSDECRKWSEKCVLPLGYQGNNLLCSDWNTENMENLDYNGMYEYLYQMKYQNRFDPKDAPDGIPAEEFESVIMEYLPVMAKQIREWAIFDEERQIYPWARLGCMNYAPTFFGTSLPEVIEVKENKDGTITLTVEAVCDMVICEDAVITHELTVRLAEDGRFQYLGNIILNDGVKNIPEYQYRMFDCIL